jgi:Domain of unknown function (DUF4082)
VKLSPWMQMTVAVLCIAGSATFALAAPTMALTLNGSPGWHNNFSNYNVGFRFTANEDLYVTHLGVYDYEGDGLSYSGAEAGIFDVNGTLLGSAQVHSSDVLDCGFRFSELTETFGLAKDSDYYAIAYLNREQVAAQSSISTDPNITFGTNVESYGGPFRFITAGDGAGWDAGFFGPNFKTVVAPEPASCLVLLVGAVAVRARRRRNRR